MFLSKGYKQTYYLYYKKHPKDSNSKYTRVSTGTTSKREANKFRDNFINTVANTQNENSNKVVYFKELQKEVIKYTSNNFENSTTQIYKRVTNDFLKIIKDKPIKQITIQDIELFKNERIKQVAKMTVNVDLRTLKAVFNLAIKWSWLKDNPSRHVKLLSIPQKEILSFSQEEIKLIINNIDDVTLKNIVIFGLLTGCRLNEICNVQLNDIDFENLTLRIRNKPNFKTKTGKIRNIPISDELNNLLKSILNTENNIINLYEPERYLFLTKRIAQHRKDCVTMSFKKVLRKLNLPEKFHFHCLRHTFITQLIKNGVNINYVKEIAGHSDIKTTMNYIHIVTEDLREAVNKIRL